MDDIGRIGLIAGEGILPVEFAKKARKRGYDVTAIAVTPNVDARIRDYAADFCAIPVTQWGNVVDALKREGIHLVFMLGTVPKDGLFSDMPMDERFLSIVQQARDGRNNELFRAFAADLDSEGIAIGMQAELLPELVSPPMTLTDRTPSEAEQQDIAFACSMAKQLAELDIGQTVVVKQRTVLAVEAMEGTNATLKRGAVLGRGDAVAVKVAKPNQDMRFDVPAIGPDTVRTMIDAGVRVLAFEAYRTLLLHREEMVRLANEAGCTLVAVDPINEEATRHANHDERG